MAKNTDEQAIKIASEKAVLNGPAVQVFDIPGFSFKQVSLQELLKPKTVKPKQNS